MKVERSRITLLAGGAAFAALLTVPRAARADSAGRGEITVYKNPT